MGLIDFLIHFGLKKQAEHLLRAAQGHGDDTSCVDPTDYAARQAYDGVCSPHERHGGGFWVGFREGGQTKKRLPRVSFGVSGGRRLDKKRLDLLMSHVLWRAHVSLDHMLLRAWAVGSLRRDGGGGGFHWRGDWASQWERTQWENLNLPHA